MNKRIKLLIIICAVFSLLYIILAALPLSKELELTPVWTVSINSTPSQITEEDFSSAIPFKLGQNIGYFTQEGKILHNVSFPYKASITDDFYSIYETNSPFLKLNSSQGKEISKIQTKGFPFLHNNEVFVFLPGGSSFSKCTKEGEIQWTYETYAPITAFDSTANGTAVGLADGTISLLNNEGKKIQEYIPGGSNYPVILGVSLSPSGNYIAAVSGQDKQRFTLAQNSSGHIKVLTHQYLQQESTNQLLIKFSRDERYTLFNQKNGLGIADTKTLEIAHLPLKGNIISIYQSETDQIFFVLSKNGKKYTVTALEPFDNFAGSFTYEAANSFIQVRGSNLYVGKNGSISKIKVIHN